jgi:REP element-mobilizing transposase RayT
MPQSLVRNVIHLIYSTKNREPLIVPDLRDPLFAYLAGTLNALKCPAIKVGGVADHVHLMFCLAKTLSLSKVVEEVKKSSSKWMKEKGSPLFFWQNGYGAFSVSRPVKTRLRRMSRDKKSITRRYRSRTSSGSFCRSTRSNGVNDTFGIEGHCLSLSG